MAIQHIIAQDVYSIDTRFYKSRAYGCEGQEFVTVTIGGQRFNHSACQNDGVMEAIVEWLNEEIKNNELATQVLDRVLLEDKPYTGANAIKKNEDGSFTISNFGENPVMHVLRSLGITLKPVKSSSRSNAYLVGYRVSHNGVEIEEEPTA